MAYRLLLADDSVTIQRVIELTFADEDVRVVAVGDGQQAIDRIAADPPDIVLADVGMPGRDGYEVAAFVKDAPALAHIPVLLLTGAFEPVDEARARAVRCDGVLAKPFEPQLLISRVKELLRPGAMQDQARPDADETTVVRTVNASDDDDTGPLPVAAAQFAVEGAASEQAPIGSGASQVPSSDISLDDYFDRLDAAFASLSGSTGARPGGAEADSSWAPPSKGAWSDAAPGIPEPGSETPGAGAAPAVAPPEAAQLPVHAPAAVPVADAFAALLEAEQHGGPAPVFVADPAPGLGAPPAPRAAAVAPAITEEFIDEVARRVADRLGDPLVRELVARVVSETAERLVREEIERLKAAAGHPQAV